MKKITILLLGLIISSASYAQLLSESFDDITTLPGDGWNQINVSTLAGATDWFQGNDGVFPSNSGAVTAYIGANFNNTGDGAGTETISNWLITPVLNVENGDVVTFYTRTTTASPFPDRLQVRISDTGATSTDPTTDTDVGSYTNLLLDINPTQITGTYPDFWTQQVINISGLSGVTDVRIAFRYFVTDGGPSGSNSDYIGIDDIVVTSTLGTNDFEKNQLSHFYNKRTDILKLESSVLVLDSIKIYNLLGQNVFSKSLSNFTEDINLTSLSDGVYIAKIKIGDGEKTLRILKQ
jgi:hypothetical protein